ncbi:MAG: hypothetical protein ACR2QU_02190 [Gammaproteobacteria bacterium]
MKVLFSLAALVPVVFLSTGAVAQDEKEAPESYVYATYFVCDVTKQDRADEIVKSQDAPVYDAAVKDGTITGWGWLAHHTGGKWRRILYSSATSMEALFAAQAKINEAREDNSEFGSICNAHDDYVWHGKAGTGGNLLASERGKVGLSAYHICKMSEEEKADELVKTVFAPVYDAHVGDGKLRSWGWSEHIIGGKYRRLATFTADDLPTLFKMRGSIFEALEDNDKADEFSKICGSHSDYIWEIQIENP